MEEKETKQKRRRGRPEFAALVINNYRLEHGRIAAEAYGKRLYEAIGRLQQAQAEVQALTAGYYRKPGRKPKPKVEAETRAPEKATPANH